MSQEAKGLPKGEDKDRKKKRTQLRKIMKVMDANNEKQNLFRNPYDMIWWLYHKDSMLNPEHCRQWEFVDSLRAKLQYKSWVDMRRSLEYMYNTI